ncbi:phage major tail tube protein [Arvimicrobium flavum]|uniref:phage major tail tube protein n=1 Tax=Arvimicrobium flavum TaxID=3393320 RepID=UPI00237C321C|nr:phage major tail tube protein [Mesorhizobium shangrilense]
MQPLYLLTAVDVRRATQSGTSRATTISKLTIPAIKIVTTEHNPGGGVMAVDFAQPRIEKVEPAFEIKGFDTDVFHGFGLVDRWVFAGAVRDKKTGKAQSARAVIEGAVTDWEPDEASPTEFVGCNHAIKEVTHYEFWLNGEELWYVDFWERIIRRKGIDLFADDRLALGA